MAAEPRTRCVTCVATSRDYVCKRNSWRRSWGARSRHDESREERARFFVTLFSHAALGVVGLALSKAISWLQPSVASSTRRVTPPRCQNVIISARAVCYQSTRLLHAEVFTRNSPTWVSFHPFWKNDFLKIPFLVAGDSLKLSRASARDTPRPRERERVRRQVCFSALTLHPPLCLA